MEAQQVLEELGEPLIAFISGHEVIEVDNKKVAVRYFRINGGARCIVPCTTR